MEQAKAIGLDKNVLDQYQPCSPGTKCQPLGPHASQQSIAAQIRGKSSFPRRGRGPSIPRFSRATCRTIR